MDDIVHDSKCADKTQATQETDERPPSGPDAADTAALSFLQLLFGDVPVKLFICLWVLRGKVSHWFPTTDLSETAAKAGQLSHTTDVYLGVGLHPEALSETSRGAADHVVGICGVWMDIDVKGPAHTEQALPETVEDALDLLRAIPLQPTVIVDTGNGIQPWWVFKEAWLFDTDQERKAAATLVSRFQQTIIEMGWQRGWKLDNTSDLARVLRIPGTLNHKLTRRGIEQNARPVRILQQSDARYNPSDFELIAGPVDAAQPAEPRASSASSTGGAKGSADLDLIERECPWAAHCRSDARRLPEPEWYAHLSILGYCKAGDELAHERSKSYPGYTHAETQMKLAHAREAAGPRTCADIEAKFGDTYCAKCKHHGKIKSPIVLGVESGPIQTQQRIEAAIERAKTGDGSAPFDVAADLARLPAAERTRFIRVFKGALEGDLDLIELKRAVRAEEKEQEGAQPEQGGDPRRESRAVKAAKLTLGEGMELFHTADDKAYCRVSINGHHEIMAIHSRPFQRLLAKSFYDAEDQALGGQALQDALALIEARAVHDGVERDVHQRVAAVNGCLYVDLGGADWSVVEISAAGWRVLAHSPIMFARPDGMLALPMPVKGGSLSALRRLIPNCSDAEFVLLCVWCVVSIRPGKPHPVLVLIGDQGSGKSTVARMIKGLVDPTVAPLRAPPRNEHDLYVAAQGSHVLAFDNLSSVRDWISDGLCRIATGGGFSARKLYSDVEEVAMDAMRPIILTSIEEEILKKADLVDRAIVIEFDELLDRDRKTEEQLEAEFQAVRPALMGVIFDAAASALRHFPEVRISRTPRMADFTKFGVACEEAFGWKPGTFLKAYEQNRVDSRAAALEAAAVVRPIQDLLEGREKWCGRVGDLLTTVQRAQRDKDLEEAKAAARSAGKTEDEVSRIKISSLTTTPEGWPCDPTRLSAALRRVRPLLRDLGIAVSFLKRQRYGREVLIERDPAASGRVTEATSAAIQSIRGPGDDASVASVAGVAGVAGSYPSSSLPATPVSCQPDGNPSEL